MKYINEDFEFEEIDAKDLETIDEKVFFINIRICELCEEDLFEDFLLKLDNNDIEYIFNLLTK